MKDSITLDSYLEIKGYKCNIVQKVKIEWVCIITTSKAKSLDEKLDWYNWLGIAHFSQSNIKHPIKTVKWYWWTNIYWTVKCLKKLLVKIVKAL